MSENHMQTTTVTKTRVAPEEVGLVGPPVEGGPPYPHVVYMNYDEFYVEGGAEGGPVGPVVSLHPPIGGGPQQQYYLENPYFEEMSNFDEEKNYFWQPEVDEIEQDVVGERPGNWYRDVGDQNIEKQYLVQNFTRWRHPHDGEIIDGPEMAQQYARDFESPSLQKYVQAPNNEVPAIDYRQDPQKNFMVPQFSGAGNDVGQVVDQYDSGTLRNRNIDKKLVVPEFSNSLGWRHPTIPELIDVFFESDDDVIKSNAAAFLQHVVYENEEKKTFAIESGGVLKLLKMIDTTKKPASSKKCQRRS